MAKASAANAPSVKANVETIALKALHLDRENPRFGGTVSGKATETEVLDTIVEKFGIDDLLSSLSMNGYFGSEPLVGFRAKGDDDVTVAEGNRRLAACLVLERDPRAKNQKERSDKFDREGRTKITKVPALVYDSKTELLAFMGVRHIAAQNPWDSYAKAHWVAEMLAQKQFDLDEITTMIGDQYNTIERMLEGYYFVDQLEDRAERPREAAERQFTNIRRWTEMPRGGDFAAWEQPDALAAEVRAFFRDLY